MRIKDCAVIDFLNITDERGSLSVAECHQHIPFTVKRVFYICEISAGVQRGGHAHYQSHEVIIPVVGSFDVKLHDGFEEKQLTLKQRHQGLYLPPLVWVKLSNFSADAVCLVLVSDPYNETDYIRNHQTFLHVARGIVNADTIS